MNKKMINCKVCNAEVAKSAKTCPSCGAKIKKKHPLLIGVIVFFILIAVIGSMGENNEPNKVDNNSSSQSETNVVNEETKKDKTSFSVGETAELKDVCVTLLNVTESTGSSYNKPSEGNVFVLCEFEIANNSDKEIVVSSMMSFEAYCDDYTCSFSLGALMEKGNKNQLDGSVAGGKKFNGVIGYEVPTDWKELEVIFTPDFWSSKDIVFVANK